MAPWKLRGTLSLTAALFSIATIAIPAAPASAPERVAGYDLPPRYVLDVLHAPAPPRPMLSPTRASALLVSWVEYPPMTQVAEPFLKLAGVRVEPRTRRSTTRSADTASCHARRHSPSWMSERVAPDGPLRRSAGARDMTRERLPRRNERDAVGCQPGRNRDDKRTAIANSARKMRIRFGYTRG